MKIRFISKDKSLLNRNIFFFDIPIKGIKIKNLDFDFWILKYYKIKFKNSKFIYSLFCLKYKRIIKLVTKIINEKNL